MRPQIILASLVLIGSVGALVFLFHYYPGSFGGEASDLDIRIGLGLVLIMLLHVVTCLFLVRSYEIPIKNALETVKSITIGYFENIIQTDGKGLIGDLFRALSFMQSAIADKSHTYEQQVYETEGAYFKLEETTAALNDLNLRLEALNASTRVMLDALDQGLFSFGADGICQDVFSRACLDFMGGSPAGQHVADFLKLQPEDRSPISRVLKLLFLKEGPASSAEDLLALFPQKISNNYGKSISLHYLPIRGGKQQLLSILAVATDHSAEETAIKMAQVREEEAQKVLRISGNRNLFILFFRGITSYFSPQGILFDEQTTIEEIRRDLHTFKGNASFFFLHDIANVINDMETRLVYVCDVAQARFDIGMLMNKLQASFALMQEVACDILGKGFDQLGEVRAVPLKLLVGIADKLKKDQVSPALYKEIVESLMGESILKTLAFFSTSLQELADRFGKKVSPCQFIGEDFQVCTETYASLWAALSHISRNVVSHAIEEPEVRVQQGKPPEITVLIDSRKVIRNGEEWFVLSFQDDGRGVDVEQIREKLRKNGEEKEVARLSDAEVMDLIFKDNLSTKDFADELSGRGVGLSALRCEAERLGGCVHVESVKSKYTKFTIEIPLLWG